MATSTVLYMRGCINLGLEGLKWCMVKIKYM